MVIIFPVPDICPALLPILDSNRLIGNINFKLVLDAITLQSQKL